MANIFKKQIDKDKVTENPHSLEYAHHVGSALIKPEDKGRIKGNALSAMEHQTDQQLTQIYEQMQLLAEQAKKINTRKEISEKIYLAEFRFEPIINHTYHLYDTNTGGQVLSVIGPNEWGRSIRKDDFTWQATVKLLADHTWEILESLD